MAVTNWLARALATAQVVTLTPGGTIEVGDIFIVTINGKSVSYAATGTTIASVATGLAAALSASTITEFAAITWADSTTHVTGTANTAGVPFTVSVSTTESNGDPADAQTFIAATTTAATGPNHWDNAINWSGGAVPVNGDIANVNLDFGSVLYGLAQSAVTLAELNIFSAGDTQNTVGLPKVNAEGYTEYLADYLAIGFTACRIDCGSPRVKLDAGSVQFELEILRTGQSQETGTPAVLIKGTNAANVADVVQGEAGFGYFDGESFAGASLTIGPDASVKTGIGAVIADTVSTGTLLFQGTGTNLECDGGVTEIRGEPGLSTLVCSGGETQGKFGGTVADVVVGPGTLDVSLDNTPRTFGTCTLRIGGTIIDPNESIIYSTGITLEEGVSQVQAA
jgi:hypothetical protein